MFLKSLLSGNSEKILIIGKGFEDIIRAKLPTDVIKMMVRATIDSIGCGGGTCDGRGGIGGTIL